MIADGFGGDMVSLPDDADPDAPEAPAEEHRTTWDYPVDLRWKQQRISVLHLREPSAKHVELAEREITVPPRQATAVMMRRYQIVLLSQVARVPKEVIEDMPVTALEEAYGFLAGLLERGRSTGAT
jgi:hypothetical protein